MTSIDKVLNDNERVIWRAKPKLVPFVLGSFISMAIILLLVVFYIGAFTFAYSPAISMTIAVLLIVLALAYLALLYKSVEYAITDKRILLKSGVIGSDFDSIDFDKLQDISVNVGLIDKPFGTGSIASVSAGESVYVKGGYRVIPKILFRAIPQPYEVYKTLKKVAFDVKAEMSFPAAYRPKETKGYDTEYQPDKN